MQQHTGREAGVLLGVPWVPGYGTWCTLAWCTMYHPDQARTLPLVGSYPGPSLWSDPSKDPPVGRVLARPSLWSGLARPAGTTPNQSPTITYTRPAWRPAGQHQGGASHHLRRPALEGRPGSTPGRRVPSPSRVNLRDGRPYRPAVLGLALKRESSRLRPTLKRGPTQSIPISREHISFLGAVGNNTESKPAYNPGRAAALEGRGHNTKAARAITQARPAALEGGRQQHRGGACPHQDPAGPGGPAGTTPGRRVPSPARLPFGKGRPFRPARTRRGA